MSNKKEIETLLTKLDELLFTSYHDYNMAHKQRSMQETIDEIKSILSESAVIKKDVIKNSIEYRKWEDYLPEIMNHDFYLRFFFQLKSHESFAETDSFIDNIKEKMIYDLEDMEVVE